MNKLILICYFKFHQLDALESLLCSAHPRVHFHNLLTYESVYLNDLCATATSSFPSTWNIKPEFLINSILDDHANQCWLGHINF